MKKIALSIFVIVFAIGLFNYSACGIIYYNVAGTWTFTQTSGDASTTLTLIFEGTRKEGIVVWDGFFMGNYTYEDSVLNFSLTYGSNLPFEKEGMEVFNGGFSDENNLSGNFSGNYQDGQASGTWTAVRL